MGKTTINIALVSALFFLSFSTYADWRCYAADQGGHTWASSGLTQEHAGRVAVNFCSAYSPNASSCHVSQCAETK